MKLLLHPQTEAAFRSVASRPGGSLIFAGPTGIGKHAAAVEYARQINCLGDEQKPCVHCRQLKTGNFAGLVQIGLTDKTTVSIEQIRNLITSVTLKTASPRIKRVVIIDDGHTMAPDAQNALLKLLEEPPENTTIIILATDVSTLLATIRSRCRLVHFSAPGLEAVVNFLEAGHNLKPVVAQELADLSAGLPGQALQLHRDTKALTEIKAVRDTAQSLMGKTRFERLLVAAKLHSTVNPATLSRFLQQTIARKLQEGEFTTPEAARLFAAVQQFSVHIRAKVGTRTALERLMLELG